MPYILVMEKAKSPNAGPEMAGRARKLNEASAKLRRQTLCDNNAAARASRKFFGNGESRRPGLNR
jgi:hypothetical protein